MKNFLKGLTLLVTLLLFTNCEKDSIEIVESKANISLKKISSNEIASNNAIVSELEKLILPNQAKSDFIYNEDYNFIVATDKATLVEKEGYNSYTFEILRAVNNGILENLVLSQVEDGEYKAYLVSYDLTIAEREALKNVEEVDLDGKVSFKQVELNTDLFISTKGTPVNTCPPGSCCVIENGIDEATGWPISYYVEVSCSSGGNNNDSGGDENSEDGPNTTDTNNGSSTNNNNGDETGLGGTASGGSPSTNNPQEEVYTSPTTNDGLEDMSEFHEINANRAAQLSNDIDEFFNDVEAVTNFNTNLYWIENLKLLAKRLNAIKGYISDRLWKKINAKLDSALQTALNLTAKFYYPNVNLAQLSESQKQTDFDLNSRKAIGILLHEFANGTGPEFREFYMGDFFWDYFTEDRIEAIEAEFESRLVALNLTFDEFVNNGVMIPSAFRFSPGHTDIVTSVELHAEANLVQFFVGGSRIEYRPSLNGYVEITVINPTSRSSLLLHSADDYERGLIGIVPLSTIEQSFIIRRKLR